MPQSIVNRSGRFDSESKSDEITASAKQLKRITLSNVKKRKYSKIPPVLVFVFFVLLGSLAFLAFSVSKANFFSHTSVSSVAGELVMRSAEVVTPKQSEKRYYSVLVMGIDTRGVKFDGEKYIAQKSEGTRKIDVIMQIIYDREKKRLNFISIPRDTSITAQEECMHQEREDQKYINRFYDMAEKNNCPFSGADAMKKYVSYITGYEVDHYIITTLDTFVELIDIVGEKHDGRKGVWIDSPRAISDYCPNDQYGYDYVYFPEGRQFLTPKRALCYVRVRKTSSDFDRNRRQQQLIDEIAHLLTSSETLSDPVKLLNTYNHFNSKMQMSSIGLDDIGLGLEIMQEADLGSINKIVLDDEFGGTNAYLTKPLYSKPGTHNRSGYYLIPTAWDKDCCQEDEWKLVREYLQRLIKDPHAESTQASIFVYASNYDSTLKDSEVYFQLQEGLDRQEIVFHESQYFLQMYSEGPDIQVYDFTQGQKSELLYKISNSIEEEVQIYRGEDAPFSRLNNEEIVITVRN